LRRPLAQKVLLNGGHAFSIVDRMVTNLNNTPVNRQKLSRFQAAFAEVLTETLRQGFSGTAEIELVVQDGTIQHFRRQVTKIET
jgi:hypothetical protein